MAFEGEERHCKRARLYGSFDEVITLIVGEGKDSSTFIVHKMVLCVSSPFFKAACKPEWMTTAERTIKLPEDDPETINAMVYWMYKNEIGIPKSKVKALKTWKEDGMPTAWGLLVRLFIAAEKFQMSQLKNFTISALIHFWREQEDGLTPTNVVRLAFDHTSDKSPLRTVLIMMMLWDFYGKDADDLEELKSELSAEALFELLYGLQNYVLKLTSNRRTGPEILRAYPGDDICENFHDHSNDPKTSQKSHTVPEDSDEEDEKNPVCSIRRGFIELEDDL